MDFSAEAPALSMSNITALSIMEDSDSPLVTMKSLEKFVIEPAVADASALYAVVDMGSNGIRFSITKLAKPRTRLLECIYKERFGISLYDALQSNLQDGGLQTLPTQTITDVIAALVRCRAICNGYNVPFNRITVLATEAVRTAGNRAELLAGIRHATELEVEIIHPQVEGYLGAMGARSGLEEVKGFFMDLGGGSVQMTYMDSAVEGYHALVAADARSFPYGAAKVTAMMATTRKQRSLSDDLATELRRHHQSIVARRGLEQGSNNTLYLCGGGFRGYGSMLMHTESVRPYPIPDIHGYTVNGERFRDWPSMLLANEQEGKIFGLSKRRRQQFPAIVEVIKAIVAAVPRIDKVVFCEGGNREGFLFHALPPAMQRQSRLTGSMALTSDSHEASSRAISTLLSAAQCHEIRASLPSDLLDFISHQSWTGLGRSDASNASICLNQVVTASGTYAGLSGHCTRAMLGILLCAVWHNDLSPTDRQLYSALQKLLPPFTAWCCEYLGTLLRFLLDRMCGASTELCEEFARALALRAFWERREAHGHGGPPWRVTLRISENLVDGMTAKEIQKRFSKVGNGLPSDLQIKIAVKVV